MYIVDKNEIWRAVTFEDYKDYYEVSNYGRVKSKERVIWHPRSDLKSGGFYRNLSERILSHYVSNNKTGYPSVILCKDTKRFNISIHILVYTAFIGEIPVGMTINHKDGDKENPFVDNLELATYGENIKHAVDILKVNRNKSHSKFYINNLYSDEKLEFDTAVDAGKYFGVSPVTVKGYSTGLFKGIFKDEYEVIRVKKLQ